MFYFKTNTTVLLTKVEVQEKAMTDSFLDTTFEAETSDHPVNLEKHLTWISFPLDLFNSTIFPKEGLSVTILSSVPL